MIIFSYLFKDILKSSIAVSLVLLLIVSSGRLAKYLTQASSGELAPELVFSIIAYRLPDFLPLILPLGIFVGSMLVFGRMYVESEMPALLAGGVSRVRILMYTLMPAFLVSMLVAFLTLWGAPKSLAKVEMLLEQSRSSASLLLFREGKFIHDRSGLNTAYIGNIDSTGSLERVFILQQSDAELEQGRTGLLLAKRGEILDTDNRDERILALQKGTIYQSQDDSLDFRISTFDNYSQRIQFSSSYEQRQLKTDALSTMELFAREGNQYRSTLHWRFSLPITVLVVTVLALAMSKTNPRKGRYARMLPAIVIYLFYIVLLSAVRNLMEEGNLQPYAIWLLQAFAFLVALFIYFSEDWLRRWQSIPERTAT